MNTGLAIMLLSGASAMPSLGLAAEPAVSLPLLRHAGAQQS